MCGIIKFFSAMSDGFIHENSYADDIKSISCYISKYLSIEIVEFAFSLGRIYK